MITGIQLLHDTVACITEASCLSIVWKLVFRQPGHRECSSLISGIWLSLDDRMNLESILHLNQPDERASRLLRVVGSLAAKPMTAHVASLILSLCLALTYECTHLSLYSTGILNNLSKNRHVITLNLEKAFENQPSTVNQIILSSIKCRQQFPVDNGNSTSSPHTTHPKKTSTPPNQEKITRRPHRNNPLHTRPLEPSRTNPIFTNMQTIP